VSVQQLLLTGSTANITLMQALTQLSLTTNLQICLDAGDSASWTGSGKWLDRSGNGYDFFLGATGTGEATDPTFNGSVGDLLPTAYWSSDGGDYFTYDTTNETWMQNLHKNNAVFTIIAFGTLGTGISDICGTLGDSGSTGMFFCNFGNLWFRVENAGAQVIDKQTSAVAAGTKGMIALSVDESVGSGGGFFYLNGNYKQVGGSNTFDSTYSSPSAGAATRTLQIGAQGNGVNPMPADAEIVAYAIWSTALSKVNLDSIFALMRVRLGV